MRVSIYKSEVRGKIAVPSSKSMTIRALVCAALSPGKNEIIRPLVSEDTDVAAAVLRQMSITISKEDDLWRVSGGHLQASQYDLFCGESAATLRFMTAVCTLVPGRHRLVGGLSLSKRPVGPLVAALQKLGLQALAEGGDTPPVTVAGGAFKSDAVELPGDISSQFVSALLFIAPFAPRGLTIRLTTPLISRPYVALTLWCLQQFGINFNDSPDQFNVRRQIYRPARVIIEGDWSSAAYFLALGAATRGIEVVNLNAASLQADRAILDLLRDMGANVVVSGNSVTVSRGELRVIKADLTNCIDLLPTVAVMAALAGGTSEFTGIGRARQKESDRVAAVVNNLRKLGVNVGEEADRLVITGPLGGVPEPVVLDSYGDHRIAMAFGVLGAAVGGITISGAESVAKTFPTFWNVMRQIGVRMEIHEQ